jgi:membrane fusion protein (multidrug efflux system)
MAEQRESGPRWKRYRTPIIVASGVVLVIGGILLKHQWSGYATTDDAQVDTDLYVVSARVPGYVATVRVGDNEYVKAGDVLVELDPTDHQVAVERARADLVNSEATARSLAVTVPVMAAATSSQLASSVADVSSADASVIAAREQAAAAHAELEEAEANDTRVQEDLERYRLLAEKQEIAAQVYAQAIAAARASRASVAGFRAREAAAIQAIREAVDHRARAEATRRGAAAGPQQVASTRARALAAEADVRQRRATVEQAELNLRYTRIVAPASGLVRKNVLAGMNVQAGQPLLTIVSIENVWITANFKETQLRYIRPGQRADITVDANSRTYKGHVDSVAAGTGTIFSLLPPENATGNYVKVVQRIPVKIVIEPGEDRERELRPGMSVVPTVHLR